MDVERIEGNGFVGYAKSEIGGRQENQDSFGWNVTPLGLVLTVCDGMGGGPAGKTASEIAVREILRYLCGTPSKNVEEAVVSAVKYANKVVYDKACTSQDLLGMGSTCTLLLLTKNEAVVAHVGDSRVYQLRNRKKHFRTFDHSMVFELVKQKVITEEQARMSAQSNVITRALGLKPKVEIDTSVFHYKKGDRFMLTTDGIHGVLPENELINIVTEKSKSIDDIVKALANDVNNIGLTNGGNHDNMTIMLVDAVNAGEKLSLLDRMKAMFC